MGDNISGDKHVLIKTNKLSHFLGAVPPIYNKKLQKFVIPNKGLRLFILPTFMFLASIDFIYLWIYVSPNISLKTVDLQEFMNFYMHAISRSCGWITTCLFYFYMQDLVLLVNVIFQTENYFEGM